MPKILVTNDDGYRSRGHPWRWPRRSAPLGEVTIVAPHVEEASAIGHALTLRRPLRLEHHSRRRLRRRRHADRLRQHRHHAGLRRQAARPRRLGHQQGLESRRRCDVLGDGGGRARGGAARNPRPRHLAARARAPTTTSATRPVRPPRLRRRCSGGRCRRGRSSTSTCRKGSRRASASPCRRSGITSPWSLARDDPKGRPYFWIEEGQNEWEPHDRSDYQAVRDGYVSVTPLHPDLTAHHALAAVEELSFDNGS